MMPEAFFGRHRPDPMRWAIAAILLAVAVVELSRGAEPPRRVYSCKAQLDRLPDKTRWWHQHITEDGENWKLLSIREGDQMKKALNDCAAWLKGKTENKK
jgi:hypothetical protein